jgi:hypothetical protein
MNEEFSDYRLLDEEYATQLHDVYSGIQDSFMLPEENVPYFGKYIETKEFPVNTRFNSKYVIRNFRFKKNDFSKVKDIRLEIGGNWIDRSYGSLAPIYRDIYKLESNNNEEDLSIINEIGNKYKLYPYAEYDIYKYIRLNNQIPLHHSEIGIVPNLYHDIKFTIDEFPRQTSKGYEKINGLTILADLHEYTGPTRGGFPYIEDSVYMQTNPCPPGSRLNFNHPVLYIMTTSLSKVDNLFININNSQKVKIPLFKYYSSNNIISLYKLPKSINFREMYRAILINFESFLEIFAINTKVLRCEQGMSGNMFN